MTTRILLVRAVNVGGAKLPMAEFRELLTELGAENVRTYIQSGNAVVELSGDAAVFDRAVERALTDRYGYEREVISRSPEELKVALERHPSWPVLLTWIDRFDRVRQKLFSAMQLLVPPSPRQRL